MEIRDNIIRYIVGFIIMVLLIGIIFAIYSGKKQDEKFENEQLIFAQAVQLYEERQYELALQMLKEIEPKHSNSQILKYYTGLTYASLEDWEKATREYGNLVSINPYLVENPMFMIQYAEILLNNKKLKEAKIVLERCKLLPIPEEMPQYIDRVNNMLMKVEES